jgi:2-aminoadipate transaminase
MPIPDLPDRLAQRARNLRSSAIRDLLALTGQPGTLSLAGGLPATEGFPVARLAEVAQQVLTPGRAARALQYATTEGDPELRDWIARYETGATGVAVDPDDVLIVTGSQQGLDLAGKALVDVGAEVAIEQPGYLGAIQALGLFQPRFLPIPVDGSGIRTDVLEARLRRGHRPVLVYVVPNFQNPTGATASVERRRQLARLADRYGFVVLEDDAYRELRFGPETPPTIREFTDRAVRLGSFSKTVAPGLRIGWLVAPAWLRDPLVRAKQAADLQAPTLTQQLVAGLVADEAWWASHLEDLRGRYAARAGALATALRQEFGDRLTFAEPTGGMFVWARFDDGTDTSALLAAALRAGVGFVPGAEFFTGRPDRACLRLSFATNEPTALAEAARRLATAHAAVRDATRPAVRGDATAAAPDAVDDAAPTNLGVGRRRASRTPDAA